MKRRSQGGFTMVELLMTVAIGVAGFAGAFGIYGTAVKANMISREYDRARSMAERVMEELRHRSIASFEAGGAEVSLGAETAASSGVTFCPTYQVVAVTTNLVRIDVEVRYAELPAGDDCADMVNPHRVRYELLRTRTEGL